MAGINIFYSPVKVFNGRMLIRLGSIDASYPWALHSDVLARVDLIPVSIGYRSQGQPVKPPSFVTVFG